jgi:hypothetical protein
MVEPEPQELFPNFWKQMESLLLVYLAVGLDASDNDAEAIADDLLARCAHVEPVLPVDPNSAVHRHLSFLVFDAVLAEQRIFAARHGRIPGRMITGYWPVTPLKFDHPFLVSMQAVVSAIEVEANKAEGGRRLN